MMLKGQPPLPWGHADRGATCLDKQGEERQGSGGRAGRGALADAAVADEAEHEDKQHRRVPAGAPARGSCGACRRRRGGRRRICKGGRAEEAEGRLGTTLKHENTRSSF